MIIRKRKTQAKLNAVAEDFSFNKFAYIQGSSALCQPFSKQTQTFLALQP